MKIVQKKKKTLLLVAPLVLVLVVAGWYGYTIYQKNNTPKENVTNYNPATKEQIEAGVKAKEDFLNRDQTGTEGGSVSSDEVDGHLIITSTNNQNEILSLRTMISRIDSEGTCILTLKKEGQTSLVREAGTQVVGSYSVCKGFDVAVRDLAPGVWMAEVTYTSSDKQYSGRASSEVEI